MERRTQMKRYENLEETMCRELDKLDKKYGGEQGDMTVQDAEKIDLLYHALKSAATYHAMKEADEEGWEEKDASGRGRSYRRGRDSMGRYTSRGMGMGYSGTYPADYGYSGHYPEWMPPYRY
jgi:hypothetical protein